MATLLGQVLTPRLKTVVLAHLSEQNNDPALARFSAEEVLKNTGVTLLLASQHTPLPVAPLGE